MRKRRPATLILICLLQHPGLAGQSPPAKKLIEFGWDRPSPAFIAANAARMDSSVFDGLVLQFSTGSTVFRLHGVDTTALNRDAALLHGVVLHHLTNNFALMNLTPDSTWDWFDDRAWSVSESNIWRLARAAEAGGLKGIALDYEPYGRTPWDFRKLPQGPGRTFADYARQVQARGRRLMIAIQSGFRDPVLLTLFQMSYLNRVSYLGNPDSRKGALAQTDYGLLPAFLAGMLSAAEGATQITDGNERAYWYADSSDFQAGARVVREEALRLIPDSLQASYRARVKLGQTVFLDYLLGIYVHPGDSVQTLIPAANRMRRLQWNLYQALRHSDEYVWLYSQKVNWWKTDSIPAGVPEAIRGAFDAAAAGHPLGFGFRDLLH